MDPDFIVVGAGAGGCIVAEKLSRKFGVLLLEAGPEDVDSAGHKVDVIHQHDLWWRCKDDKRYHWPHMSTPQTHLPNQRQIPPNMGRVLGGSTSHNAQFYVRCNPEDFNRWESVYGMHGWNFDKALAAWRRLENTNDGVPEFHGKDGPLRIRQADDSAVWDDFQKVCNAQGIPISPDHHASQLGAGKLWANVDESWERQSLYRAVLHPVRAERADRLKIEVNATVQRLVFEGKRVVGVEFVQDGAVKVVKAKKEVILCAGAIKSPHILMLSGIGDGEHLRDVGIEPKVELPGVGLQLQDHIFCPAMFSAKQALPPTKAWSTFQLFGRNDGSYKAGRPDFQLLWCARERYELFLLYFRYLPDFPKPGGFEDKPVVLAAVCVVHPHSKGSIKLADNKPTSEPLINPNYLTDDEDMYTWRQGYNLLSELTLGLTDWVEQELAPNAKGAALENFVKAASTSMWHPVGTCSMAVGHLQVVDTHCRVRGVDGLRVVDASIIPELPSGNTMCPTLAVAEIGSDLILADH